MQIEITEEEKEELLQASLVIAKLFGKISIAEELEFQKTVLELPTFGERLRSLREHNRYTQAELARICGISEKSIQRYESNQNMPLRIHTLCEFAYWLHCNVDLLLGRKTEELKR